MYGVLTAEQVDIVFFAHKGHLLLLFLQRGPWSEIFNNSSSSSPLHPRYVILKVLVYASATVSQPFSVSCSTLETHLSGLQLAP